MKQVPSKKNIRFLFVLFILFIVFPQVYAQDEPSPNSFKGSFKDSSKNYRYIEDVEFPVDEKFVFGVLENKLQYFIRENDKPKDKITIQLSVKTGSVYEEENEQGIAHFLEHMAFNGTKNFPGKAVREFMRSQGIDSAQHINASTSFYETKYYLELDTKDLDAVMQGMQIVRDWLFFIDFEEEEIEKERGVVLSEKRGRQGASQELFDYVLPAIFVDSIIPLRLPIGKEEQIERFSKEDFLRFYKRWYHPQNAALMIAGDIDAATVENMVKSVFSLTPTQAFEPPNAVNVSIPMIARDKIPVLTHEHEQHRNNVLTLVFKSSVPSFARSKEELRLNLGLELSLYAIRSRLSKLTLEENASIFDVSVSPFLFRRDNLLPWVIQISIDSDQVEKATTRVFQELERFERYGLLDSEIKEAKDVFVSHITLVDGIEPKENSSYHIGTAEEVFFRDNFEDLVDKQWLSDNIEVLLSNINTDNINALYLPYLFSDDRTVFTRGDKILLEQDKILDLYAQSKKGELDLFQEEEPVPDIAFREPRAPAQGEGGSAGGGGVVGEAYFEEAELRKMELANGITVYSKNTTIDSEYIYFEATKRVPLAVTEEEEIKLSRYLPQIIQESGLANLSPKEYKRFLNKQQLSFSFESQNSQVTLSGSSRIDDFELLLQILHETMTETPVDPTTLDNFVVKEKSRLAQNKNEPYKIYSQLRQKYIFSNDPRRRDIRPETLDNADTTQIKELFQKIFGNFYGFDFVFVGNIDSVDFEKQILRYVLALPSDPQAEVAKENPYDYLEYEVEKHITFESIKQSTTLLELINTKSDRLFFYQAKLIQDAVEILFNMRLNDFLREEQGLTYSPYAWVSFNPQFNIVVLGSIIDHQKAERERVIADTERIMQDISLGNITFYEMQEIRKSLSEKAGSIQRSNELLLSTLSKEIAYGREAYIESFVLPGRSLDILIESLNADMISGYLRHILQDAGYLKMTISEK